MCEEAEGGEGGRWGLHREKTCKMQKEKSMERREERTVKMEI